jgi:hypothetical protein
MALIESKNFTDLKNNYSNESFRSRKQTFKNVYITGAVRDNEEVGKMQVVKSWEGDSPEFILNNQSEINFITMFIKKMRVKVEGGEKERTTCFSYTGDAGAISTSGRTCPTSAERANTSFCKDCRFQMTIAGALLDEKMKPVKDPETDKTVLIYFKNSGMKYMPAQEYIEKLQEKATELPPLSDDPDTEATLVTPRRFITKVKVGKKSSNYGQKLVFEYEPSVVLPDKAVVKILEDCKGYTKAFDEQFDASKYIKKGNGATDNIEVPIPESKEDERIPIRKEVKKIESTPITETLDLGDLDIGI